MNTICRICLKESTDLQKIFEQYVCVSNSNLPTTLAITSIADIITECTKYPASRNDKLPSGICNKCTEAAQAAHSFKTQTEQAYCHLKALYDKTWKPKEPAITVATSTQTECDEYQCKSCSMLEKSRDSLDEEPREEKLENSVEESLQEPEIMLEEPPSPPKTVPAEIVTTVVSLNNYSSYWPDYNDDDDEDNDNKEQLDNLMEADPFSSEEEETMDTTEDNIDEYENMGTAISEISKDNKNLRTRTIHNKEKNCSLKNSSDSNDNAEETAFTDIKIENEELGNGDVPVVCSFCDKSFFNRETLSNHMQRFHGEKPFKCDQCPKAYGRRDNFVRHIRRHNKEKSVGGANDTDAIKDIDSYKVYKCNFCEESFSRKPHLKIHERTHTGRKPNMCTLCDKSFERRYQLTNHMLTHSEDKPYKCNQCPQAFSLNRYLKGHMRFHAEIKPHSCPYCPKSFVQSSDLKVHVRRHTGERFKCELCPAGYLQRCVLNNHMRKAHGVEVLSSSPAKAKKVGRGNDQEANDYEATNKYEPEEYLESNLDDENNAANIVIEEFVECDSTNEMIIKTTNSEQMSKNNNEQTCPDKQKPELYCELCKKKFSSKVYYEKHQRLHQNKCISGEKKFLCSICGDNFKRNEYLTIHMRKHTGERPYKCRFCEKAFKRSSEIRMHERYHTGQKQNFCNICGKGFYRPYSLNVHMRTHTGEKPYKCSECSQAFTQSNDLKAHMRRHTGERFKCELCSADFLHKYDLTAHLRNVHSVQVPCSNGRLVKVGIVEETILEGEEEVKV